MQTTLIFFFEQPNVIFFKVITQIIFNLCFELEQNVQHSQFIFMYENKSYKDFELDSLTLFFFVNTRYHFEQLYMKKKTKCWHSKKIEAISKQ